MKKLDRDPPNAHNPTNVSKADPKAAKIDAKSPKDVPKAPKRHPKGDQKATKRHPKSFPERPHEI